MSEPRPILVRIATASDAAAIAHVHVETWKTTYSGLLPKSYIDQLSEEVRAQFWAKSLAEPAPRTITLVATEPSAGVVGFICGGPERTGELGSDGELYAIYLLSAVQSRGLGTQLTRDLASRLASLGFQSMAVWVLEANPFKRFYEKLGAQFVSQKAIDLGGESFTECAYRWPDVKTI